MRSVTIGMTVLGLAAMATVVAIGYAESQTAEQPIRQDSGGGNQGSGDRGQDVEPRGSLAKGIVVSLMGEELKPVAIPAERRAMLEDDLAEAKAAFDADPTDEDAVIWYGRRLAYLGLYQQAQLVYTEGLMTHKNSLKLLRHRGHRWITLRELELARGDLSRAARSIHLDRLQDQVEPDGQPNAAGIPTSTLHTNIWYHLGLAQYLMGDYKSSRESYEKCLAISANDDMRAAASYWLYLNHRRLGEDDAAAKVLDGITADMNIIENETYQRLLLLFKGDIKPEDVPGTQESAVGEAVDDATMAYGVAMWHLLNGRADEAQSRFEKIAGKDRAEDAAWAAFGYIAAEAELARTRDENTDSQPDK